MTDGQATGTTHGEAGMTIVEMMVAMLVLTVGVLGTLAMFTGTLRTTKRNNARVAATNLAREIIETSRGVDYDDLSSGSQLRATLQARGLGSGTPWTITRRDTTYTVTATTCSFDDPKDSIAASPPANACTPAATGAPGDNDGDDFRRVTLVAAWQEGPSTLRVTQSSLIVNPTGGLGPRNIGFSPATQTIQGPTASASDPNPTSATSVSVQWTTGPTATSLRWDVDDGASGNSISGATPYSAVWQIGACCNGNEVLDGLYKMTAVPYDERDIAGEAKRADILLNRRKPYAPPAFDGGHDTRAGNWLDFEWGLNSERDILGYRVYWTNSDGIVNANDQQVCPVAASYTDPKATSCTSFDAPAGTQKYYVVAVDQDNAATPQLRRGDERSVSVADAAAQPSAPTGLTIETSTGGFPRISWNAAGSASFYRVYRDGTAVTAGASDRYGRVSAPNTSFTDTNPGESSHTYHVSTVDSRYNESAPAGPVAWSP